MAVAVKNPTEAGAQSPFDRLAITSLVGLAYIVGSIGIVFYLIPGIWHSVPEIINPFVTGTLMIVVMLAAGFGLGYLGLRLAGFELVHGLRAGMFVAGAGSASILATTWIIGRILESALGNWPAAAPIGGIVTAAAGLAMLFFAVRWFLRPDTEDILMTIEDQGWFSMTGYKKSQGQRVRRGTMLGIIALAVCGIWTLHSHNTLAYGVDDGTNNWYVSIPFSSLWNPDGVDYRLNLLRDVRFTVPILFAAVALWFAYRVVNFPSFADFLIATEAELNKVSWTSRKRLVQDTIVVLTTVVLMTIFLFVVDILWGLLLSRVGVLQSGSGDKDQQKTGRQEQPW
jgi:preprotein translocase SecE subunit